MNGAKTAGGAVASAAKQLKTPAIAAGVGLAGVAGGIALGRGTKSKKSLSILPGRSAKATSKKLSGRGKERRRGRGANRASRRTRAPAKRGNQRGTKRRTQVAGRGRAGGTHQAQRGRRTANLTYRSRGRGPGRVKAESLRGRPWLRLGSASGTSNPVLRHAPGGRFPRVAPVEAQAWGNRARPKSRVAL